MDGQISYAGSSNRPKAGRPVCQCVVDGRTDAWFCSVVPRARRLAPPRDRHQRATGCRGVAAATNSTKLLRFITLAGLNRKRNQLVDAQTRATAVVSPARSAGRLCIQVKIEPYRDGRCLRDPAVQALPFHPLSLRIGSPPLKANQNDNAERMITATALGCERAGRVSSTKASPIQSYGRLAPGYQQDERSALYVPCHASALASEGRAT